MVLSKLRQSHRISVWQTVNTMQNRSAKKMKEAAALGSKIIVFPELCITGYTCEDLFWQEVLLNGAKDALDQIRKRKP